MAVGTLLNHCQICSDTFLIYPMTVASHLSNPHKKHLNIQGLAWCLSVIENIIYPCKNTS